MRSAHVLICLLLALVGSIAFASRVLIALVDKLGSAVTSATT